jgi:hypothetical protein
LYTQSTSMKPAPEPIHNLISIVPHHVYPSQKQ